MNKSAPVLTADQMAQVHHAESMMEIGELERPPSELERLRADDKRICDLLEKEGVCRNDGESGAEMVGNYILVVRNREGKLREALHECLSVLNRVANVHGYAAVIRAAAQAHEVLNHSYSKEAHGD